MIPQKAVLLVGSPRGNKSVSLALGARLLSGLTSKGVRGETHTILGAHFSEEKMAALLRAIDDAGILIFSFPLYVDHLPAPVIEVLDRIAARRAGAASPAGRPLLAALVQCGFPETHQNQPAIDILRRFAELNGYEWAGGLAMGMGGAAGRRIPEKPSGMLRNVLLSLDRAAAALAEGRPIPEETRALMGKPLMPKGLYFAAANWGMKSEGRKNSKKTGGIIDLYARPFA